jgi:hypothetical protein
MLTSVTIGCPHAAWLSYRAPLLRLFRCFVHRSNSCPIVNGCGFGTPGNDVLPDLARAESRLAKLQWSLWTPTTTQRLPSLFSFLPFARIMALLREDQSKKGIRADRIRSRNVYPEPVEAARWSARSRAHGLRKSACCCFWATLEQPRSGRPAVVLRLSTHLPRPTSPVETFMRKHLPLVCLPPMLAIANTFLLFARKRK